MLGVKWNRQRRPGPILFLSRVQMKTDPNFPICRVDHLPSRRNRRPKRRRLMRDIQVRKPPALHSRRRVQNSELNTPV